jgi:hypothetical protein
MAKKKKKEETIPKPTSGNALGMWSFNVGFIVAILVGLGGSFSNTLSPIWSFILIISGLLVGFLNVQDVDAHKFMIAGAVLVFVSWVGGQALSEVEVYSNILDAFVTLFVPATIIVTLRNLFVLGHK